MTKTEKQRLENEFQTQQKLYSISHSQCSWNKIFYLVMDCVSNIAKSKLHGVYVYDLDEKILDITLSIMEKIQSGIIINKLSSFCYLPTIGGLYDRKKRKYDKILSLDQYQESHKNNKSY